MKIRAFRNLTRKCYSIQLKDGNRWLTFAHAKLLIVKDVKFVVREKARIRVVASGHKEVHAYVEGTLQEWCGLLVKESDLLINLKQETVSCDATIRASYNPKTSNAFHYCHDKVSISTTALLYMESNGIFVQ